MALLCLCWAGSASAGGSIGVGLGDGECSDFSARNIVSATSTTIPVTASLSLASTYTFLSLDSFIIVVNGTSYTATTTRNGNVFSGTVNVPLKNPMRLLCYATAKVTYSGTALNNATPSVSDVSFTKVALSYSELFDSRNATNDPDGTTGQGKVVETIYSNIRLRGMRFDGRPCDAYDHVQGLIYPITKASQRYHWFRDNPASTFVFGGYPAVYLKSSTPQLNIQTEPLNGSPVQVKATIDATTVYTANGFALKPPGYPLNITQTLPTGSTTLTLPTLPGYVNSYALTVSIHFQCQKSDNTWSNVYGLSDDSTTFRIYAINAAPNAPMTIPWVGVLEDSCRFGKYQSTTDDVAKEETRGVYYDKQIGYPLSTNTLWVDYNFDTKIGNPGRFRLTDFLNTSGKKLANCVDVSDYLCICANSQGLNFKVSQYGNLDGAGVQTKFVTNPVCLIGGNTQDGAPNYPDGTPQWSYSSWEFHQICQSQANAVYDACAAQKFTVTGQIYRDPPVNWPLGSYWQSPLPAGGLPAGSEAWKHLGLTDFSYAAQYRAVPNPSKPIMIAPFGLGTSSFYVPLVK